MLVYCREEELQLEKRKKRKIKGNSRLSFADDFESENEEENGEIGEYTHTHTLIFVKFCCFL